MSKRFDREALLAMPHKDVKARYQAMFGEAPRSPNKTWMVNQMEEEHARRKVAKKAERTAAPAMRARRAPEVLASETASDREGETTAAAATEGAETAADEAPSAVSAEPQRCSVEANDDDAEEAGEPHGVEVPGETAASTAAHVRGRFRSMTVDELRTLYAQTVGRATSSIDKHYLIWKIREAQKGKIRVGPVEPGQRREGVLAGADKTLPLTLTARAVEAMDAAWRRTGFASRMTFMRTAIREALASRGEEAAAAHIPEKGVA